MKTLILSLISTICLGQNSMSKKTYDSIYQSDSVGSWSVVGTTDLVDNPIISDGSPTWESSDLYLPPPDTANWVLWDGTKYEAVNDASVKLHQEVYSELRKMWVTIFVSFGITYVFIALILYKYKKK